MKTVLSADLGGTKTLLRLSHIEEGETTDYSERQFVSADFSHLSEMINVFLEDQPVHAACFAVAGPVQQVGDKQTANITNLPWQLDSHSLSQQLDTPEVKIINDFQAIGYGIDSLPKESLLVIQTGDIIAGANRAILGAGTGLGQAFMISQGDKYTVYGCEGGHTDFAPNNEEQIALLQYLQNKYGHVSYERLLSGQGLQNIYEFLIQQLPDMRDRDFENGFTGQDIPALISQKGMSDPRHICAKALNIFVTIYGAKAGNLALSYNCTGGVYIAGGIGSKISSVLNDSVFRRAFNDKGRMSSLTERMPVYLITDSKVGLYGAEYIAKQSIA